ncbi:MAG TPA: TldD/PmbA family protein [Actinomycetota bacterium]|nr:TldD/PmbA family protein [Actinomycetota bacterium]
MDLLEVAAGIVDRGRSGEALEAFVTHEREFHSKAFDGEIESISSAEPRGAGVRTIVGDRAGFAYTTDLSTAGLDELVEQSRENASFASEDEAVALAPAWTDAPGDIEGLFDDSQSELDVATKVAFAVELETATRAAHEKIRTVEEAVYADSSSQIAIATSEGISSSYRRSDAWCYTLAIATDGDENEVGFEFDLARGLAGLDAEAVARRAASHAVSILGAGKIPSQKMPVVFDPYVAGQFLGVLGQALTGEAAQKGRSLFAGKLGEQVAATGLTLVDDGRLAGAPGSSPWDDEGVPTQRTEVIGSGVLNSFLYDVTTARRESRESTGNASRAGFKSAPGPAPSNMAFEPTGESVDELLKKAGTAFLVQDFHGVHSGANAVSGDFSVGATGRLLKDGELGQPVKEVTIACPMLDILKGIVAVAPDRRWLPFGGSYGGSTTLIAEMTVAGS